MHLVMQIDNWFIFLKYILGSPYNTPVMRNDGVSLKIMSLLLLFLRSPSSFFPNLVPGAQSDACTL